jgi:hypothetical protein
LSLAIFLFCCFCCKGYKFGCKDNTKGANLVSLLCLFLLNLARKMVLRVAKSLQIAYNIIAIGVGKRHKKTSCCGKKMQGSQYILQFSCRCIDCMVVACPLFDNTVTKIASVWHLSVI